MLLQNKILFKRCTKLEAKITDLKRRAADHQQEQKTEHDAAITELVSRHDLAIQDIQSRHDDAITDLKSQHDTTIADLQAQIDTLRTSQNSNSSEDAAQDSTADVIGLLLGKHYAAIQERAETQAQARAEGVLQTMSLNHSALVERIAKLEAEKDAGVAPDTESLKLIADRVNKLEQDGSLALAPHEVDYQDKQRFRELRDKVVRTQPSLSPTTS